MKTKTLSGKDIELPSCFSSNIREDIVQKVFEIEKKYQPFAPFLLAGKLVSASGKIRHARKVWKTAYGHGISRVPRKIFWRRGNQFYWRGAFVVSTVGGRRAHPPKVEHFQKELRINKKEKSIAFNSSISSTTSLDFLKKRNPKLDKFNLSLPLIIENSLLKAKGKDVLIFLEKNIGKSIYQVSRKRAGKGKMKLGNKKSPGLLLVIGNQDKFNVAGIDVKKVNDLQIKDFWPLGRLTVYSENAIKDLEEIK